MPFQDAGLNHRFAVEIDLDPHILRLMTDNLKKLLEAAKTARPTPGHPEEQRRSFVYGNTHLENEFDHTGNGRS